MEKLFTRPNGMPYRFYLCDLNNSSWYKNLIESKGGKVELKPVKNVLTFTTPEFSFKYQFVFNVKYITDCVYQGTILNVNDYYIGDLRFAPVCRMSKFCSQSVDCFGYRSFHNSKFQEQQDNFEKKSTNVSEKIYTSKTNKEEQKSKPAKVRQEISSENDISDTEPASESSDSDDSDFDPSLYYPISTPKKTVKKSQNSSPAVSPDCLNDLKEWADSIRSKNVLDQNGYPAASGAKIMDWEKEVLIEFLIRTKQIAKAKSWTTWKLCRTLKILPQRRNKLKVLPLIFLNHVLPYITKYGLSKNIEEEFLQL